jgi:hypothetical protein
MKDLVVESFIQNPNSEAAKKLLQYENFTHNTNELIDKAFLEGLKLAQQRLLSSQQPTSVEGAQVAPEVRYKDAAKRIRIEYPSKISQESFYNDLNSNELIQLSRIEHSGNIAEQIKINQDYGEAIAKKYGEPAGDYVGETESEITIEEAEFLRDHPQFAKDFIEGFLNSELGDGKTLQEYAQALLDQNETLIDTAQGRLFTGFDTTNEFTDAQKNKILANFGAQHKMNVEKAREYINQAMAEEPQKTIDKLKECYL